MEPLAQMNEFINCNTNLAQENQNNREQINKYLKRNEKLHNENLDLKEQMAKLNRQNTELFGKNHGTREEKDKLKSQNAELLSKNQETREESEKLKSQNAEYAKEKQEMGGQIDELKKQNVTLVNENQEIRRHMDKIKRGNMELANEMSGKQDQVKIQKLTYEAEKQALQTLYEEQLNGMRDKLERDAQQMNCLREELSVAITDKQKFSEEVRECQNRLLLANQMAECQESTLTRLTTNLITLENRLKQSEASNKESRREADRLSSQLLATTALLDEFRAHLAEKKSSLAKANDSLECLQSELIETQDCKEKLVRKLSLLEKNCLKVRNRFLQQDEEIHQLEQEVEELRGEVSMKSRTIRQLNRDLFSNKQIIDKLEELHECTDYQGYPLAHGSAQHLHRSPSQLHFNSYSATHDN